MEKGRFALQEMGALDLTKGEKPKEGLASVLAEIARTVILREVGGKTIFEHRLETLLTPRYGIDKAGNPDQLLNGKEILDALELAATLGMEAPKLDPAMGRMLVIIRAPRPEREPIDVTPRGGVSSVEVATGSPVSPAGVGAPTRSRQSPSVGSPSGSPAGSPGADRKEVRRRLIEAAEGDEVDGLTEAVG